MPEYTYQIYEKTNDATYLYYDLSDIYFKDLKISYMIDNYDGSDTLYVDSENNILNCVYGYCDFKDFSPKHMLIKSNSENVTLYAYQEIDLLEYSNKNDKLLASNKTLSYNKSAVNIKYHRESENANDQVVVLPITYSDEWKVDDSNYEIVEANSGFVGIVVKNGVKDIDVTIKFEPKGVKKGIVVSVGGIFIYFVYLGINICIRRKKEISDEDI